MILIVDDNDHVLDWMRQVIQEAGYYFDAASDSQSAFYKMGRLEYAIAFIDIGLPDYSGDVLAEMVKKLPPPRDTTPLIGMTGGTIPENRGLFLDIMQKPFGPNDLRAAILRYARPPVKDLRIARAMAAR